MKKGVIYTLIGVLVVALLAALVLIFWDPIVDTLPIDQSGWETEENIRRYLNEDGDPLTGWQDIDGSRYYFDPATGAARTGWLEDGGRRYFLSETDGSMVTGWLTQSDNPYYMNEDGTMATGWVQLGGSRYYFDADGIRQTGWLELEGQHYHFSDDGVMTTGWLETEAGRYFLLGDGTRYSGWLTDSEGTHYLDGSGVMTTGWQDIDGSRYYLNENGLLQSGWQEIDGIAYYLKADGSAAAGWLDYEEQRYYLNADGSLFTGWLELDGAKYYLKEDGSMAKGRLTIEDKTYFFTSTGANIILVNPWNYLPEDYEVELIELDSGHKVSVECYDALMKMLSDCEAAGHDPYLYSSYRTQAHQERLFNNMVKQEGSKEAAAKIVAVPGTSEHQLGLAVDITDNSYRKLNSKQEETATQQWLMEHSWEYGFNLRYPNDKSEITGIIYEPWHYRYVGLELAKELHDLDLCLEEYLDMLTGDGTSCGGPQ